MRQKKNVPHKRSENNSEQDRREIAVGIFELDAESRLLLLMIGEAFAFDKHPAAFGRYSKPQRRQIHGALILLQGLGLVEETDTPFGWRATDRLLRLIVTQTIQPFVKDSEFPQADDQPMLGGTVGVSWPPQT